MKALAAVFRLRVREEMQYRGAVIGGIFCQTFFGLILIAVYRAMYETRPQAILLQDIVNYVWLQQAFFRMILTSDSELTDKIRNGGFVYDLCRPLDTYWYYFARGGAQKLVGSLFRSLPMMLIAFLLPEGWRATPPASLLALFCSFVSLGFGLACVCALNAITTGFTIRTLDGRGMEAALNLLMMTFSGNIIPLTLFPDSWQTAIRLLPYAQMLDAPIRIYGGQQAIREVPVVWLIQGVWTMVLICLGRKMWNDNQKRIVIQGG